MESNERIFIIGNPISKADGVEHYSVPSVTSGCDGCPSNFDGEIKENCDGCKNFSFDGGTNEYSLLEGETNSEVLDSLKRGIKKRSDARAKRKSDRGKRKMLKAKSKADLRTSKGRAKELKGKAKLEKQSVRKDEAKAKVAVAKEQAKADAATAGAISSQQQEVETPKKGMSKGAIIGIVAGGLLLIGVAIFAIVKMKKKKS